MLKEDKISTQKYFFQDCGEEVERPDGGMMGKFTGGTFVFCLEHKINVHRQRPDLSSPDCLQTLHRQKLELSSAERTGLAEPGCSLHT